MKSAYFLFKVAGFGRMWDQDWSNGVVLQPLKHRWWLCCCCTALCCVVRCWTGNKREREGWFLYSCGIPAWPSKGSITFTSLFYSIRLYSMMLWGFIYEWMQQWGLRSLSLRSVEKKAYVLKSIVDETGIFILLLDYGNLLICATPQHTVMLHAAVRSSQRWSSAEILGLLFTFICTFL